MRVKMRGCDPWPANVNDTWAFHEATIIYCEATEEHASGPRRCEYSMETSLPKQLNGPWWELIIPIGAVLVICTSLASIFLGSNFRLSLRKSDIPQTAPKSG
jgi:hypothetical protein